MKRGYGYIAIAVVMFTSFEVVLKFIAGQINPVQLTLCRFAIGFVFLLPMALHNLKKRGKRLDGKSMAYFALLGLIGIALCMPILQMAVSYTGSSVSALMFSCNPVFVAFLAFFLLKEPIKARHIAALVLEILGTIVIINPWNTRLNMTGVALALLSTLLFSLYGVMGKRKVAEYGGAVVTCFGFLFGSLIVLAFILLTHIPAVAAAFRGAGLDSFANIPILAGYTLQQAKSRLWESGLNVGEVVFDEGINLLNQKDARVYAQSPGQERTAALGSAVDLRLTLDCTKSDRTRAEAEKAARGLAEERRRRERAEADSLAKLRLEEALTAPEETPEAAAAGGDDRNEPDDEFFF